MTLHQILLALVAVPAIAALTTVNTQPPIKPDQKVQKDVAPKVRPGVFIKDSAGNMVPLRIRTLDVAVEVKGAMATTTFDITVHNPHGKTLEGEFSFPLTDGQTVSRFALDINGHLREGVVVSKEKGRVAYEATIRQRIDPALLEWTNDNAFRTRIYPILPNGTRRIVIAYEQPLMGDKDGYTYRMPFAYDQRIDTFRLHAAVAGFGIAPSMAGDNGDTVEFSPRGRDFLAEFAETDIHLNSVFTLSVPVIAGRTYSAVSTFDGTSYVGMFLSGRSIDDSERSRRVEEISLVVDASLSAASRDKKQDRAFLDAMFKRLRNVDVQLITFAHRPLTSMTYTVTNGDWSSIRSVLDQIRFDGATQLGAVPFDKMSGQYIVLLSDGISTIGRYEPVTANAPVICVASGVQADHDVLRGIAQRSGGQLVDLSMKSVSAVVPTLFRSAPLISEVNVLDGSFDHIRPQLPVIASDMTTITGVLGSTSATVEVVTTLDGNVIGRDTVVITERSAEGTSMARLWAQLELQRLNMDRRHNAGAIEAVGKRFTIVTPGTSLIVLDRIEDYVRHRITPPSNEPDMVSAYNARIQHMKQDSVQLHKVHLERVVRLYAQRQQWYRTGYPVPLTKEERADRDNVAESISRQPGLQLNGEVFTMRGSRKTDTQVLIDALTVTDDAVAKNEREMIRSTEVGSVSRRSGRADAVSSSKPAPSSPENSGGYRSSKGTIALAPPANRAAYLEELSKLSAKNVYDRYHQLRKEHGSSTAFYIDVAELLREKGDSVTALRVLSNLAELHGEDAPTLRILGYRLRQLGYHALAVMVFEDVVRVRGEEPQSYRDLGLALADAGRKQDACDRLYELVTRSWDNRFPEVELIALYELNRIVADSNGTKINTAAYDPRLLSDMPVGMRVVLSWDADNCDMDLWVTDPNGEKCFYSNRKTKIGGAMSRDLTGGYGPEEFLLKTPIKGTYTVQVHYFGDTQLRLAGPTTIHVDLALNTGAPNASQRSITTRVEGVQKVVDIGTFTVE